MTRFEIRESTKGTFALRIKDDQYPNSRAIIYDDWIAKELANDLGIKIQYRQVDSAYPKEVDIEL